MIHIWERYFLKEILKIFVLFLFVFFFLYAIMDYSTHMQDFIKDKRIQISDLTLYYLYHFIKRAILLVPLALLVATIKVLSSFNMSRELVALQACGMRVKTLLRPFLVVAGLCTLFNYASLEFFLPKALNFTDQFHESHFKHYEQGNRKERMHVLHLKDNSKLVYQTFDKAKGAFFDVVWIRSANDIWRIKYLDPNTNIPAGKYVDHLQRNSQGLFEKTESFDSYNFNQIKWRKNTSQVRFVPIENRRLSELYRLAFHNKDVTSSYEKTEIITQLAFKLAMPLLSLLVVIAAAPFCVVYSRALPVFFIYALALFGFVSFFTLMDAAVILGENQVIPPLIAIFSPLIMIGSTFFYKFAKTS